MRQNMMTQFMDEPHREQLRVQREQEELKRLKEKEHKREEMIRLQREEERKKLIQKEQEEKQKAELEKQLKSAIEKHNMSAKSSVENVVGENKKKPPSGAGRAGTFNVSSSANQSMNSSMQQSYDMTPLREKKPSSDTNYNIEDLNSGDETDDEENPRKKIPFWAQGAQLKAALIQQFYNGMDTSVFFGPIYAPELSVMFEVQRKRFHKRTSSAIWNSPLLIRPTAHSSS